MRRLKLLKLSKLRLHQRHGKRHGIDFYVPENLSIFDFAKDPGVYVNDNIQFNENFIYQVPFIFYLKSDVTVGEYTCQLVLKYSKDAKAWSFHISEVKDDKALPNVMFDISKPADNITRWLIDKGTVISKVKLLPHGKILIPSGIHMKLPENVFLKFDNKSGIASKRGLIVGADVVDVDYEGEVHLNLINSTNLPVYIKAGEKIVQGLPLFQPKITEIKEVETVEELYKDSKSERGAGGFGSSGN